MEKLKVKAGTVIRLTCKAFGEFGIITVKKKNNNAVLSNGGFKILFDDETLAGFPVIGLVKIDKRYGNANGRRFANVSCADMYFDTVVTRIGAAYPETTAIGELRIAGFMKMFPAEGGN